MGHSSCTRLGNTPIWVMLNLIQIYIPEYKEKQNSISSHFDGIYSSGSLKILSNRNLETLFKLNAPLEERCRAVGKVACVYNSIVPCTIKGRTEQ